MVIQKRRRIFQLLTVVLTLAVCFAIAELGCRIFIPAKSLFALDIFSQGAEYELSQNPRLIYTPKKNAGDHNSYGHRGREFPFEKSEKSRIVFMGDSVVEGFGVEEEFRFTEVMNRLLGDEYEVINLGVCGYDFRQEVEYFKELGLRFSPDYVFWGLSHFDLAMWSGEIYALNDIMEKLQKNSFYMNYYGARGRLERLLLKSHAYRCIRYLVAAHSDEKFEDEITYNPEDGRFRVLLQELKALEAERGFKIVFVYLPTREDFSLNNAARQDMKTAVAEAGFLSCDPESYINERLGHEEKSKLFIPDDMVHFTPLGHGTIAELLSAAVVNLP